MTNVCILSAILVLLGGTPNANDIQEASESYTIQDVDIMTNILWNEARGVEKDIEIACVAWTICNRVNAGYGTLHEVMTAENQFAYIPDMVFDENDPAYVRCRNIAEDVLARWTLELAGAEYVGRVLPEEYLWYTGDGIKNYFRDSYNGSDFWNYSLPDVYEND